MADYEELKLTVSGRQKATEELTILDALPGLTASVMGDLAHGSASN
jgi:hypothetical protein